MFRKVKVDKPHNGGRWSRARYRSFIVSALRGASLKWGPKWACIDASFVGNGKNPATGRNCKLHRCSHCQKVFPKGVMRADHIEPVVDPEKGFTTWDDFIGRMFVEAEHFQSVCKGCHDEKTKEERGRRTIAKRRAAGTMAVRKRTRSKPSEPRKRKARKLF